MITECQNCGEHFQEQDLKPLDFIEERVAPGEMLPAGVCPDCGCVCHYTWDKTTAEIVNEIENHTHVGWDTDSILCLLNAFIMNHSTQRDFESYMLSMAKQDKHDCEVHSFKETEGA